MKIEELSQTPIRVLGPICGLQQVVEKTESSHKYRNSSSCQFLNHLICRCGSSCQGCHFFCWFDWVLQTLAHWLCYENRLKLNRLRFVCFGFEGIRWLGNSMIGVRPRQVSLSLRQQSHWYLWKSLTFSWFFTKVVWVCGPPKYSRLNNVENHLLMSKMTSFLFKG